MIQRWERISQAYMRKSPTCASEMKQDMSKVETTLTARIDRLEAKIDHVDEKLGNFENREIDKRLQLEVRVERLEKQRF